MKLPANSFLPQSLLAAFNTVLPYHLPPLSVGTLIASASSLTALCRISVSGLAPLSLMPRALAAASVAFVRVKIMTRYISAIIP